MWKDYLSSPQATTSISGGSWLCKKLDYFLCNLEGIEIVSGTARGADALVEQYANEHDLPTKQFPADWDK